MDYGPDAVDGIVPADIYNDIAGGFGSCDRIGRSRAGEHAIQAAAKGDADACAFEPPNGPSLPGEPIPVSAVVSVPPKVVRPRPVAAAADWANPARLGRL